MFDLILHGVLQVLDSALLCLLLRLNGDDIFLDPRLEDFTVPPDLIEVVLEGLRDSEDLVNGLVVTVHLGFEVGGEAGNDVGQWANHFRNVRLEAIMLRHRGKSKERVHWGRGGSRERESAGSREPATRAGGQPPPIHLEPKWP